MSEDLFSNHSFCKYSQQQQVQEPYLTKPAHKRQAYLLPYHDDLKCQIIVQNQGTF